MRRSIVSIAVLCSTWVTSAAAATTGGAAGAGGAAAAKASAAAKAAAPALSPLPHNFGFVLAVIAFAIVGVLTIALGITTDLLRGSQPTDFGGAVDTRHKNKIRPFRRAYSLAQTQMAWWFCIVLSSYLYIAFTDTNGAPTFNIDGGLNNQVLILLGIGVGTALGAAMIEQVKSNSATPTTLDTFNNLVTQYRALPPVPAAPTVDPNEAQRAALAAEIQTMAPKVASEGFLLDLLTDVNGISLHRFQAFGWTIVLGGMFIYSVVTKDVMPAFSATLLALLGISNGAYLGFKVPEQAS